MPRHKVSKTRKRVSSSSSSSSLAKNYRFKRAVLVRKRVGSSTTPAPTWKVIGMAGTGSGSGSKSPMKNVEYDKFCNSYSNYGGNGKGKDCLSARKLGATLWEINGLQSPSDVRDDVVKREKDRGKKSFDDKVMSNLFDFEHDLFLDHQYPHNTPLSQQKKDGSKVGGHRRRSSAISHKLQITEYIAGGLDTIPKTNSLEVTNHVRDENNPSVRARLKDVNNSLIASKELVKVLFRILSQEEKHSSRLTLVLALKIELDRARVQLDQLIQDRGFSSKQSDTMMKQFLEEKASWKKREKEMIREVEIERKLRRQAERLNKKLGAELGDTRAHLSRAMKELENERRSRETLEQTCDELARGIGEERVEVEELKKESEKVREEVEKERQMLQLADVLREERVQMKLTDARYEFEEKNEALERLRCELEAYLKSGTCKDDDVRVEIKDFVEKTQFGFCQDNDGKVYNVEEEDDSCDSELHSIELNMDTNNKCYKWSFVCEGPNNQGEVFKGRKSLSEKIQWESICLQRKTSDGIEWDFKGNKQANVDSLNDDYDNNNEHEDELKRFKAVTPQRFDSTSPAMSTGKSSGRLREACTAILQDLALKREKIEG